MNNSRFKYFTGTRTVLGSGKDLVSDPFTQRVTSISRDLALLASTCSNFATLEEHAARILGKSPRQADLINRLREAVNHGLLMSLEDVQDRITSGFLQRAPRCSIEAIGIPTRNRPDMLYRVLSELTTHMREFGRALQIVVIDDSETAQMSEANREAISKFALHDSAPVLYENRESRRDFAERLARRSGVDPSTVSFCVNGCSEYPVGVGASRNTILLKTAGRATLYVDDDVLCKLALFPEYTGPVAFGGGFERMESWFFRDPAEIQHCRFVSEDIIGLHEAALNFDQSAIAKLGAEGIDFTTASEGLLRRLDGSAGSVAVSLLGIIGDTAIDYPTQYFLQSNATLKRLTANQEIYRAALTNRAILRGYTSPVLAEHLSCMSYCMAVDNTELLPPFLPVQRAEEIVFGALVSQCVPGSLFATVPRAVLHQPREPRRFPENAVMTRLGRFMVAETIAALCNIDALRGISRAGSLETLGSWLQQLADAPGPELNSQLRRALGPVFLVLAQRLDSALHSHVAETTFWKSEVTRMLETAIQTWNNSDCAIPLDLEQRFGADDGRRRFRSLLRQFGSVLRAWPSLNAAAREISG